MTSDIWNAVSQVLEQENFSQVASQTDRRPLIQMANELGGPPMRLLYSKVIDEFGRIPHRT